jgi:hypothetical protein
VPIDSKDIKADARRQVHQKKDRSASRKSFKPKAALAERFRHAFRY